MKIVIFIYLVCICGYNSISQENSHSVVDTIRLDKIFIKDSVVIKIKSTTILTPYKEFDTFLHILKNKVYKASYMKTRQREIRKAISILHEQYNSGNAYIGDSLKNLIFPQFISAYLVDMIENRKVIILKDDNSRQLIIIREKSSYSRGLLNAWGGRRYYLMGEKAYFLSVADWVS